MFRPQEISATDARKYFTQIINKVQFSSKSFVVRSYRRPTVRIVREEYIAALEQVIGKKTVSQILQISGNDNLFDATKIIEIKKIFQRRLSSSSHPEQSSRAESRGRGRGAGSPQQQPRPHPQPQSQPHSPVTPKQQTQPKPQNPTSHLKPPTSNRSRGVLLLSNGKSYE